MVEINGTVAQGFEKVADAFRSNFDEFPELGAGFALYADGEAKVDIWAVSRTRRPAAHGTTRTLQLVFSTTKGAAAICVARLVDAGSALLRRHRGDPLARVRGRRERMT